MGNKEDDLIKLLNGEEGRFLESDDSYYGRKTVNSNQKDKFMETDCGGMIITKSKMTYGDADKLADTIDLKDMFEHINIMQKESGNCYWGGSYWNEKIQTVSYKERNKDKIFRGEFYWAIWNYLTTKQIIEGKPESYNNALEYLFNQILINFAGEGFVLCTKDFKYFKLNLEHTNEKN